MMSYEIANALTKIMKRKKIDKEGMINAFNYFERIPLKYAEIKFDKALEIAWEYNLYAYDSCYLELARRLNLPLLTFDNKMVKIAKELGITILGGNDVNI